MEQRHNGSGNGTDIWAALSRPFSFDEIKVKVLATNREKTRGLVVPYVDARAVMQRLDDAVGPGGWSDSYDVISDGVVRCRLTVAGVTKEDVGLGDDPKSAFSDALKRASVKFGCSRTLYDAEKVWADLDNRGQIVNPEDVKQRILPRGAQKPRRPTPSAPRRPIPHSSNETIQQVDDLPF